MYICDIIEIIKKKKIEVFVKIYLKAKIKLKYSYIRILQEKLNIINESIGV